MAMTPREKTVKRLAGELMAKAKPRAMNPVAVAVQQAGKDFDIKKLTDAQLADYFGPICREKQKIEKEYKAAREEFERRGLTNAVGKRYAVLAKPMSRENFDYKQLMADYAKTVWEKYLGRTFFNKYEVTDR